MRDVEPVPRVAHPPVPHSPVPRRDRHLMDPAPMHAVHDVRAEQRSLTRVRQWVASSLAVTTILYLATAVIAAALYVPERSGQVVLCLLAGDFGLAAVVAALGHPRTPGTVTVAAARHAPDVDRPWATSR